ncbi:hypothetical protein SteCoe_16311 [Stentor coeruleus]|uniref:t-SNARE coiled-coil homology domain-containing protein n=1 Tax=Stentor coeruleus TaxID=5963 RepID=A0A1R2C1K2_9CILI|nr:hypothetical protein SteCoe_16311 [Stentor coeruleus]
MKEDFELIEKTKSEHNVILEELAISSETIKGQCIEIDDELDVHNRLLGKIESFADESDELVDRMSYRLGKLLEGYSNSNLMCTIIALLVILIVLLFL